MARHWRRVPRSLLLGVLAVLLLPASAVPQGVGIYSRPACTSITSPVQGQTVCFDQTANIWKVWNGTTWISSSFPTNGAYPAVVSVADFGAKCDGATDDTVAIRTALNLAASTGVGVVTGPNTTTGCNITSTIIVPRGVMLEGFAPAIQNVNPGGFVLNHNFNGTFLQFDGSGSGNPGGGYGIRNVTLRQRLGTGTTTAGVGTALRIVCTSANTRATWVRIENTQIEETSSGDINGPNDPWTIGIDVDGTGCNGLGITNTIRDTFILNGRIQVGATTGTPHGVRVQFAANTFMSNMEVSSTNTAVDCLFTGSGGNQANTVYLSFLQCPTLALDQVTNVMEYGGLYTNITNTANTGKSVLFPLTITNAFTNNAPLTTAVIEFQLAAAILGGNFNQGINFRTPILMNNGNNGGIGFLNNAASSYLRAMQLSGAGNNLNVGIDAATVNINPGLVSAAGFGPGVQIGAPTGTDRGVGTINIASSVLLNGVVVLKSTGAPTCINLCGSASLITATGTDTAFLVTLGTSLANSFTMKFATANAGVGGCNAFAQGAPQATATAVSANVAATGVTINLVGAPANNTAYFVTCKPLIAG